MATCAFSLTRNVIGLVIIASFLLAGCEAGSGEGLDAQGLPLAQESETSQVEPTLEWLQDNVFSSICADCHAGANPAAGQNLSTLENTIDNLIGVPSSDPAFLRVQPGAPESSYLYLKITGDPRAGARMPLGRAPLAQDVIDAIKAWIEQGALLPETALSPTRVSRSQWQLEEGVERTGSLLLWFNRPMNFAPLSRHQIEAWTRTDTQFRKVPAEQVSLIRQNSYLLQIKIASIPKDSQTFGIRLNDPKYSSLLSSGGEWLDGDTDGQAGGAFEHEFPIDF